MEKVKLNIVPKGKKTTCYASQNDNGRVVRFELFNELIPYILDGSETISIKVVRPDSEEILASIENTFEGKDYIDVVFNTNMTAIAGVGECEITITDGETVLGSRNFDMNIEIDAYNGRDVIIETSTGTLAEFDTEVEDNALEYESEIPYRADGYTGLRVINTRTAPVYDKTPYLFRKTPSGYGNSCIEKLNGLTVAFNQIQINNASYSGEGITFTYANNKLTVSGTASSTTWWLGGSRGTQYPFYKDHVYLFDVGNKNYTQQANAPSWYMPAGFGGYAPQSRDRVIKKCTESVTTWFQLQIPSGYSFANPVVFMPQVFDLTQMFGSTIADYLYNLETQTAGAGVSVFKSLFGADFYPYNAGELMSVKTSGRKTIGFNQFDINNADLDNGNFDIRDPVRTLNVTSYEYTRILPSTSYCWKNDISSVAGRYVRFYDINKNEIDEISLYGTGNKIFNTPDNAAYCRFMWYRVQPITVNEVLSSQVCINISDPSRNGEYEPYNAVTYPLDPDLELRGIPKLDANNKLYGDGDEYESSGTVTRKYQKRAYQEGDVTDGLTMITDGTNTVVVLATPTSESADPFTDPQEARITEEFIDERSIPIPVGHDTIYGTDIEYQDIDFDTTIFGGEIDAVNGVLSSEYNSDGSVKTTPEIIDITPTPIPVRAGENKIFNSANGNQTIRYYNQVEE